MSLGKHTKCDLSAGIAKLDITVLTRQTERRFFDLLRNISKQTSEIQNTSLTPEDRKDNLAKMSTWGADYYLQLTQDLAETTELLHTLYESNKRTIEIVR